MRIMLFFLLLSHLFLVKQMNCAQNSDVTLRQAALQALGPVVTHGALVLADRTIGLETRNEEAQRRQSEGQVKLTEEQVIGAQIGTKTARIQRQRELVTLLNERYEATVKHFARPENKNRQKDKEIALAMIDIEIEEAMNGSEENRKQRKSIKRDGKTYKDITKELTELEKDSRKNKDQITDLKKKQAEIKNEAKQMKKDYIEKVDLRKKEKTEELEKKHANKDKNKENINKDKTGFVSKMMNSFTTITEYTTQGLDTVADKTVARITKHDTFKDTFVATHALMINRALVVSAAALIVYGMYKLYDRYANDEGDIYDNDADDDESDDE